MKKIFLMSICLSWMLLTGCTTSKTVVVGAEDKFVPETPTRLTCDGTRIASFNGEFLFDGEGDEGSASFEWKGNPSLSREHRDKVAQVIRNVNADVLLMAEVENENVLQKMVSESLSDMGYKIYFVQGQDSFTGQDVAVLSRLPIEKTGRSNERAKVGDSDQLYGVSKNLYARLTISGIPTTIIGIHFLAQPSNSERKAQREAQAEVMHQLALQEAQAGRAVIFMGDYNDYDDQTLDRNASVPISNVLKTLKSMGAGTEDDLHNLIADVPQVQRFSSLWDKNNDDVATWNEFTAIDHILMSPVLYRKVRSVRYVHAHDPTAVTDHFPVTACLAR
jgi:endonuclease/exonuclease/phosphatase family metal-dependent hydrolase